MRAILICVLFLTPPACTTPAYEFIRVAPDSAEHVADYDLSRADCAHLEKAHGGHCRKQQESI